MALSDNEMIEKIELKSSLEKIKAKKDKIDPFGAARRGLTFE